MENILNKWEHNSKPIQNLYKNIKNRWNDY